MQSAVLCCAALCCTVLYLDTSEQNRCDNEQGGGASSTLNHSQVKLHHDNVRSSRCRRRNPCQRTIVLSWVLSMTIKFNKLSNSTMSSTMSEAMPKKFIT
ncbi:hypothetical protein Hamer_G008744 [Homarus americanus]|uniref:Secreted protein n=1 Tax=Homarus americanus TaxID=6706 RepID=A0A8J5JJ17_HOMAM|nr:hypothetical protein Hamer_G008744 [Homarus americanus]